MKKSVLGWLGALLLLVTSNAFGQTANATIGTNQDVSAGNSQAVNAGNAQSITFNGGPSLPNTTGSPGLPAPGIFAQLGNTPGSASVPFVAAANKLCNVRYTRAAMPSTKVVENTDSGQTRIIFSAYPAMIAGAKGVIEVEEVLPPDLSPTVMEKAVCLGTITIVTKENAGNKTDFSVVQNDAMHYLFGAVRGFKKVGLVSLITGVSAASGVSTDASSFGIAGVLGHLVSAVTSAGIGPTFGKGSGNTTPSNFPGGTFLIVALEEENGQTLDMSALGRYLMPQQVVNANGTSSAIKGEVMKR
jgi:hypothetical protein